MCDPTLPDGNRKQNPTVVVIILFANAEHATTQHSDPHHGDLVMPLHYWAAGLAITNKTRAPMLLFYDDLLCELY